MTDLAAGLQALADEITSGPQAPSGCLLGVTRDGAVTRASSGTARPDGADALTPDTPFHIASVGKMITATLVLQLVEQGAFGPRGVDTLLPELADRGVLPLAFVGGLHPSGAHVSLRHLLSHTSGMKDMQVDDATGTAAELGAPAPDSIQACFWRSVRDAQRGRGDGSFARHVWRPWDPDHPDDPMAGHLNRFLATGTAAAPAAEPGERFHYSDTAYVVLGMIVEAALGVPLHAAQREHVLDQLGMASTYLAGHDDPPGDARRREMEVWVGDVPLLSSGFSLSFDWGGGGQVSTLGDLLRLVEGVYRGTCLHHAATRELMLAAATPRGLDPPRVGIGLGIQHVRVGARVVVGHAGAWGVRAFRDPATGIAVASTVGRRDDCAWLPRLFDLAEAA